MCGNFKIPTNQKFEFKENSSNPSENNKSSNSYQIFQIYNKSATLTRLCKNCLRSKSLLELGCGHRFCLDCISKELVKQSDYLKINEIICWVCFEKLDFRLALSIIHTEKIKKIAEFNIKLPDLHQCQLCYSLYLPNFFKKLNCGHSFCTICIFLYISQIVARKEVKSGRPTCPDCPVEINPEFIIKHFPIDLFEKLNELLAEFFESIDNECRISRCKNCQVLVEVGRQIDIIKCSLCKKNFCQYCYQNHVEGRCKFKHGQTVKNMNDKRCPRCFSDVYKETGCNFVSCPWPECKGRYFCYLCLKPLTESEHYSHFPDGAYVNNCETLESLKENINNN